jgi:hypothetical protein
MLGKNASHNAIRILFVMLAFTLAPGLLGAQTKPDKKNTPAPAKPTNPPPAKPATNTVSGQQHGSGNTPVSMPGKGASGTASNTAANTPGKGASGTAGNTAANTPGKGASGTAVNTARISTGKTQPGPFSKPKSATVIPRPDGSKTYKTPRAEYNVSKTGRLTDVKTSGAEAKIGSDGNIEEIQTKKGLTIQQGRNGSHRIESTRADGTKVVSNGHGTGYTETRFTRNGQTFATRTYVVNGHTSTRTYAQTTYLKHVYYRYVPAYYYGPAFYGWAYNAWGAPVYYGWGWGYAGWYGFYGPYFVASPFYAGPIFWLTDYVISQNLQAAYAAEVGAAAPPSRGAVTVPGNQAWTDTGKYLNAGDDVTITAGGTVSMGGGWPLYPPAGSGKDPNCGGRGGFPAGDLPCWSLIGRVGDGPIFEVGIGAKIQAPNSGELLLGVNDNILGDNTGAWYATVVAPNTSASGAPSTNANDAALAPEVKDAIAAEVKTQIDAETAATQNSSSAGAASTPPNEKDVPAALNPKHSIFIVSSTLSEQMDDGQSCSLTGGDILTRTTTTPDTNQNVRVLVTTAKKDDCATGTQFGMSIQDLQDMYNDFQAKTDEGLKELAQKQGKGGIPASPAPGGQANPAAVGAAPDPNAAATLKDQDAAAAKAEGEIDAAIQTPSGN